MTTPAARAKRRYAERHPERVRASKAAYRERNRERLLAEQRERRAGYEPSDWWVRNLKIRYRMTPEQFDELLVGQAGRCALCRSAMMDPCIDHCHETKRVRGLLCRRCNLGLGHFQDDPVRIAAALYYLQENRPEAG